jgi:hypothetical protein
MEQDRLNLDNAKERLKLYPNLACILGNDWIAIQYQKPIKEWTLINGWISSTDPDYAYWLEDLDYAVGYLRPKVSAEVFKKIATKLKSHSDRANTKGTLSEISIMMFLAKNDIRFDLEKKLISGDKDVDISAEISGEVPVNIEIQWLSPSDISERGAEIASLYGEAYTMDYDSEEYRIKKKVFDKTPKLTREDITFIALDCTTAPELGGPRLYSPIGSAVFEAFTGKNVQGETMPYAYSQIDITIRNYVDGVIWFQLCPGNKLLPKERGIVINPSSGHRSDEQVFKFQKVWLDEGSVDN